MLLPLSALKIKSNGNNIPYHEFFDQDQLIAFRENNRMNDMMITQIVLITYFILIVICLIIAKARNELTPLGIVLILFFPDLYIAYAFVDYFVFDDKCYIINGNRQ
jgi:hypothetical protein